MRTLIIIIAAMLCGCTQPESATRVLADAGYTEIEIGGYGMLSCSDDDYFRTSFTAKGPSGRRVSGVVCAGLFKGSTIRLD